METYKQHPKYKRYEISDKGNVRNIKTQRVLKQRLHHITTYPMINLRLKKGVQRTELVHRLVAEAHYGEIPDGMVVDHIDRNRENANLSNLRIVTPKENLNNRILIGEKIPHIVYNPLHKTFQVNGTIVKDKREALNLFQESI